MTGVDADLATLREARRSLAASLIAVKGHLDEPYPDDPRWTPWTRFIERELQRLDETKTVVARVEAELSRLREERDAAQRALWRCYVVSGADPDGDDGWHTTPDMACKAAVDAVEQLRSDYNEALDENRAAEARCARLQQALDGACDAAIWLTGLGEIPVDSAWPDEMRPKLNAAIAVAREALAGPDTPADSQPQDPPCIESEDCEAQKWHYWRCPKHADSQEDTA